MSKLIYTGKDVTFTLGGVEIKGVLTKDLEMTNKDKYIPKVGDKVLTDLGTECLVLYAGEEHVFVRSDSEEFSADFDYFKPIPTKADVEREQLMKIIGKHRFNCIERAIEIQKAGFTIPKKVKRSELADVMESYYINYEAKVSILSEICNLLGDLVEDD